MGGHAPIPHVPNPGMYKSIKGIPPLEKTEKLLAEKGLKDPWMRNEIWRYPDYSRPLLHMWKVFRRGFWPGLATFGFIAFLDYGCGIGRASKDKVYHEMHGGHH